MKIRINPFRYPAHFDVECDDASVYHNLDTPDIVDIAQVMFMFPDWESLFHVDIGKVMHYLSVEQFMQLQKQIKQAAAVSAQAQANKRIANDGLPLRAVRYAIAKIEVPAECGPCADGLVGTCNGKPVQWEIVTEHEPVAAQSPHPLAGMAAAQLPPEPPPPFYEIREFYALQFANLHSELGDELYQQVIGDTVPGANSFLSLKTEDEIQRCYQALREHEVAF